MSAVDRFLLDPVDFLQNNVVSTPEGGSFNETGGRKYFTLQRLAGTATSLERPGVAIPTFLARPAGGGNPDGVFEAYWCPYKEDSLQSTTVSNGANIMLTAPMNGCSFGAGPAAPDGSRYVAHINMKSQPNAWNKQDAILRGSRAGVMMVSPHMYMGGDRDPVHVITFGVRDPSTRQWRFYYQLTKTGYQGGTLTKHLIGVFPV
ncbi:hypothetical protein [Massilia oculi]|uniref:hypothetical protein n=1 Tax=Massilia oculi TaxID=945844 RepID=UPI0028B1E3DC|nr:hypothetical protein [Massilia oculi]